MSLIHGLKSPKWAPPRPSANVFSAVLVSMVAVFSLLGNPVWSWGADSAPLSEHCLKALQALPGTVDEATLTKVCSKAKALPTCASTRGKPIFSVETPATGATKPGRKILVFALIHGDEAPAGSVARSWMTRLETLSPRNQWRVVPILNPDGLEKKTRFNANGVDLNRNFPTQDWAQEAEKHWREKAKADVRRFPGKGAASELETRCAVAEIQDFKPDFIISIHTPYGLLDFDGPRKSLPRTKLLPWRFLGHYPGSLGRYMWFDQGVPVMTVELKETGVIEALESFDALQDLAGEVALQQKIQAASERAAPKP